MKVDIKDAPNSQKEIAVELPYEKFQEAMDVECDRVAQDAKIPGFRPGKAPKDVVMKQNIHRIRTGALEYIISNTIRDVLMQNNINPISRPEAKDVVLEDDKPISFTIMVDVFPEFKLENYKGFDFDKISIKVTQKDVDDTIEKLREQHSELKPVAKKRKVKQGDHAVIDFEGKLDGVPFDGGKAEKHTLEIGSGQFIPGFEDGVMGMSIGESKDINVKFPDEYHAENLAGQDVVFTVVLHEVKEKISPELDDEFAQKVAPNFKTAEDFLKAVEKDLQSEADNFVKLNTFTQILNKLIEENPFEVPVSIITEQAREMAQQNLQQYYRMGINPEMLGITPESFVENMMPEAEKQIKRALIINRISEDHKLEVTEDDINAEFDRLSELSGRTADDLKKDVLANDQYAGAMRNDLMSDKVYKFLEDANKISETVMTRDEYEKDQAEKAAKEKEEEDKPKKAASKKSIAKKASDDGEEKKPAAKKPASKPAAKSTPAKSEDKPETKKATTAKKPAAKKKDD